MNKEKKTIIIEEILHWKRNKMLPHTYCDFLLALYTEGNIEQSKHRKKFPFKHMIPVIITLFLPLTLIVTYFTEFSFILQMLIVSIFLIFSLITTAFFYKNNRTIHLSLSVSAILLLILTIDVVEYMTGGNKLFLSLTIFANCCLWIYLSRKLKLVYLLISGIIGFLSLLFVYFF
ncbi:hypothetical protein [Metabacillus fastidiosus]|uniref:hypothetical protein n=1 Tax=Metabacillus fastidiosus TaxID=1458 RepID=UPI002DBBA873|nr:hypothetical protein [Metabacillus fastidiosus]MEC2076532.1 hypothetical protein [Metabacillus fastidiosus]